MSKYRMYDATLDTSAEFEAADADAAIAVVFDIARLSWTVRGDMARVTAVKSSMVADKRFQILATYEDNDQEYYLYEVS